MTFKLFFLPDTNKNLSIFTLKKKIAYNVVEVQWSRGHKTNFYCCLTWVPVCSVPSGEIGRPAPHTPHTK